MNWGRMNWRWIDPVWTVRGSAPLEPGQGADQAFARLDGLFRAHGTTRWREADTLTFAKAHPLAQDKLAIYDRGTLIVADGELRYEMVSRALLFCLLASPFFLGLSFLVDGSRISGRVFAGLFLALYVAGRWLEPRLALRLFRRRLAGDVSYRPPELSPITRA